MGYTSQLKGLNFFGWMWGVTSTEIHFRPQLPHRRAPAERGPRRVGGVHPRVYGQSHALLVCDARLFPVNATSLTTHHHYTRPGLPLETAWVCQLTQIPDPIVIGRCYIYLHRQTINWSLNLRDRAESRIKKVYSPLAVWIDAHTKDMRQWQADL